MKRLVFFFVLIAVVVPGLVGSIVFQTPLGLLLQIALVPACVGTIVGLLLQPLRRIDNAAIDALGWCAMLIVAAMLLVRFLPSDAPGVGLSYIALSLLNVIFYHLYEITLHLMRCPECHRHTVHLRSADRGKIKLYCRRCQIRFSWYSWMPIGRNNP